MGVDIVDATYGDIRLIEGGRDHARHVRAASVTPDKIIAAARRRIA